jgi:hypothetical protein
MCRLHGARNGESAGLRRDSAAALACAGYMGSGMDGKLKRALGPAALLHCPSWDGPTFAHHREALVWVDKQGRASALAAGDKAAGHTLAAVGAMAGSLRAPGPATHLADCC